MPLNRTPSFGLASMLPANRFAFKEWAVICEALRLGRQSLILRKGGIHEGRAGFRVEHDQFWLFPTNFHQSPDDLSHTHRDLWQQLRPPPDDGQIPLRTYVVVEQIIEIDDESLLPRLNGMHAWSGRVLRERFHYKRPGLFALLIRAFQLPTEICLPNLPHFAGCRSWVDLPTGLSTADLQPVLDDARHHAEMALLREKLSIAK